MSEIKTVILTPSRTWEGETVWTADARDEAGNRTRHFTYEKVAFDDVGEAFDWIVRRGQLEALVVLDVQAILHHERSVREPCRSYDAEDDPVHHPLVTSAGLVEFYQHLDAYVRTRALIAPKARPVDGERR